MKRSFIILICVLLVLSLAACASDTSASTEPAAPETTANEIVEQAPATAPDSMDSEEPSVSENEMPLAVGDLMSFDNMRDALAYANIASISLPEEYPEGYRQTTTFGAIEGKMVETSFTDGSGTIVIRKGLSMEDVYGDDTMYPDSQTVIANGMEIRLEGENDLIYLALWTSEGYAYAIQFTAGIDSDFAANMAGSTV